MERVTPPTARTVAVLRARIAEVLGNSSRGVVRDSPERSFAATPPLERRAAKLREHPRPSGATLARAGSAGTVLRHTAAVPLPPPSLIRPSSLWLGHETVTHRIYRQAGLALKKRAIAPTTPRDGKPGCLPNPRTTRAAGPSQSGPPMRCQRRRWRVVLASQCVSELDAGCRDGKRAFGRWVGDRGFCALPGDCRLFPHVGSVVEAGAPGSPRRAVGAIK
jgi:hypothetical protein